MGHVLTTQWYLNASLASTGYQALTAGSGDSATVASFRDGTQAFIEEMWAGDNTTKALFQVYSPRMHDQIHSIQMAYQFNPTLSGADGDPQVIMPNYVRQPVYQNDILTIQCSAAQSDSVGLAVQFFYEDLPGNAARLITWEQLRPVIETRSGTRGNIVGVQVSPTAGASAAYGTAVALNNVSTNDILKANTDYALIGGATTLPCTLVSVVGPDTGNYRIGFPGHWDQSKSNSYFVDQSVKYGGPRIPVINANNKGNTLIYAADAATNVATAAVLYFVECGPTGSIGV